MRSRTIREGSVGLLILLGLGILGGMILWIRGLNPAKRSFTVILEFPTVDGVQAGGPVRYRGVTVGKVVGLRPGINLVEVKAELSPATLQIPKNASVQISQSGFVSETGIDIQPTTTTLEPSESANPLSPDCNPEQIVCDGDRLVGTVGVSYAELIRSLTEFSNLFANPEFFAELRQLTRNSAEAATGVSELTGEVTDLAQVIEQRIDPLAAAATSSATSIGRAADQLALTSTQVNSLLVDNRTALISTLDNLSRTSSQLEQVLTGLTPIVESGQFVQNLEVLSANAAEASTNLRNFSTTVGSTENILLLQQTLDSARATFQNAQKITSDLDDLTGDPAFRTNIRDLVDGLNGLVSTSQQLQQHAQMAQLLAPAEVALEANPSREAPIVVPLPAPQIAQPSRSTTQSTPRQKAGKPNPTRTAF